MRLLTLLLVIVLFATVGLATTNGTILLFTVPFLLLILLGVAQSAEKTDLTITRVLSATQTIVGSPVTSTLTITNKGRAIDELYITDLLPDGLVSADDITVAQSLKNGESTTLTWQSEPTRGIWDIDNVQVAGCNRFGFFPFNEKITVTGQTRLTVVAQPDQVGEIVIRPRQTRAFSGTIPAKTAGSGSDFFGVRQYRPGDSLRHVNWRATAKKQDSLFTNEFEEQKVADVGLIVDARQNAVTVGGNQKLLEYGLDGAAAFADAFLGAGNRVSLLVYGHVLDWVLPGYGKFQRQRVLTKLASVQAGESQIFSSFSHLPIRLFPPKSQIVLFTPLLVDDVATLIKIRAREYSVMVIAPDSIAWEAAHLPQTAATTLGTRLARIERTVAIRELTRAGIQVVQWNVNEPLEKVVRMHLRRPFGRMI